MRLIVDERPYPYEPGDSLLIALLRAGIQPTGGGLCLGDCPNCLATVDGMMPGTAGYLLTGIGIGQPR